MDIGPLEYVVIGVHDPRLSRVVCQELSALRKTGLIRVVDLLLVVKAAGGAVTVRELSEEEQAAYGDLADHLLGLLTAQDVERLAGQLPPDSSALVVVLEHAWVTRLTEAIRASRGVVYGGRLVSNDVLADVSAELTSAPEFTKPRGGLGRGGFGVRRRELGVPLLGTDGIGGTGSPLVAGLTAGGIGYLPGSNANMQAPQMPPPPQAAPAPASGRNIELLQKFMLGVLHDSGVLTDEEYVREKNWLLNHWPLTCLAGGVGEAGRTIAEGGPAMAQHVAATDFWRVTRVRVEREGRGRTTTKPIRVLVVGGHTSVRKGIRAAGGGARRRGGGRGVRRAGGRHTGEGAPPGRHPDRPDDARTSS